MKTIEIMDNEAERIDELCEKYGLVPWEVIELALDNIDDIDEKYVFG